MKTRIRLALGALLGAAAAWPLAEAHAADCEGLVGRNIGGGTVVAAERWAAGHEFVVPTPLPPGLQLPPLAAPICRVTAKLSPVPGSEINAEVWLPETWNGKLVGTGGGGFSGGLASAPLTLNPLVGKGYAAAATDVGHAASDDAKWAFKQPAKLVDWAHRGNHVTAVFAKALIDRFYGEPVQRSYFQGCSNGGRDALMEAWRYPQDYDGIVAGAPAAAWTRLMTAFAWNVRAVEAAGTIPAAKLKLVNDAVLARCDALDGVKDGVLEAPSACRFDPGELQCKSGEAEGCLTPAQATAFRAIYAGPRTRDGRQISAGYPVGSEAVEWANWITNEKAAHRQFANEYFRWMVHEDETWTLDRFDLERDFAAAQRRTGAITDADNPDIRPFLQRGGKLILWHGWADAALPPGNTITYYEAVQRHPAAAGQVRLFMAPGVGHCFGGPGPSSFDMLGALDQWVAGAPTPERIVATKLDNPIAAFLGLPGKTVRSRPLCAWPKRARWNGSGSTDEEANFSCVAPGQK